MRAGKSNRSHNRRRENSGPRIKLPSLNLRRWLPLSALALAAIGAVVVARIALNQPLKSVAVEGRFQRVLPLDIEKAVRVEVGKRGLISTDLDAVSQAVRRIPWVDRASVARDWPNGLRVYVVEQTPVARWGETGLLNTRGQLFVNDARHIPQELPELVGPPGTQAIMTERYLAAQSRLVQTGLRLTQLRLDARGAWELSLDNGVVLRLGRAQVDERFERFVTAAARIVASRAAEISYIDLRYASGFSIGWRGAHTGVARG
jgi:cell division protein FtsQ